MGIRGLTSYINQTHDCLSNFELRDTPLVIDSNAVVYGLYNQNVSNHCFGGDYAEFANYVFQFFEELLQCKVTPLVIIDGAMEDKKLKTLYRNSKQRIMKASNATPCNQQAVLPPLTKEVFKYIMREMNIKCVTSLYEADDDIASIARILNCPVLSSDSDFYIFDVIYIPFDTLKQGIIKSSTGNGFFKNCKMFKSEYLLKHFPGVDKMVLPLISALLGNDYVETDIFKNFFSTLKVPRHLKNKFGRRKMHLKIEALFMWIKNYTLDEAVARILNKIDSEKYQSTLKIIEMVINGYLNPSSDMLGPLGYSPEVIEVLKQKIAKESYKFDNSSKFDLTDETKRNDETDLSADDNNFDTFMLDENTNITVYSSIGDLNKIVPSWFMEKFKAGLMPSYFMDLINRQFFVPVEQMEDCRYPACMNISLKIYKVIFQLLNNGTTNLNILKYIARGKGVAIERYEINCKNSDDREIIPTLQELINLPIINRKQILINTLGVSDKFIVQFPPAWRMYIIAIKYWLVEADEIFRTKYHLYALIFLIIRHVIKKVMTSANHSYFEMNLSKIDNKDNSNDHNFSVKEALINVKEDECIFAERFFMSKIGVDRNNFDMTVVHAFSLFQSCLRSSMELNALLGHPYPNINVAQFFSGTLIYNLYNDFKNKPLNRVQDIFKKAPSVLQVFIAISTTIEAMLQ